MNSLKSVCRVGIRFYTDICLRRVHKYLGNDAWTIVIVYLTKENSHAEKVTKSAVSRGVWVY